MCAPAYLFRTSMKQLFAFILTCTASCSAADLISLNADEIMRQVAANQDRGQKERTNFVYEENVHVATRLSNGKVAREEWTNALVTPSERGTEKKLQSLRGRYLLKGKYVEFQGDPAPLKDSLDGGLTSSFRRDLTRDSL